MTDSNVEQLDAVDARHEVEEAFVAHRRTIPRDVGCLVVVIFSVKELDRLAEAIPGFHFKASASNHPRQQR